MDNKTMMNLATSLLNANGEEEVVQILRDADLWDDRNLWRLYGDKEGNFATAGNQQALPEAALVEKLVNCVDSRLMSECLQRGIDPESAAAPTSIREAVATFFADSGSLVEWTAAKRTEQSRQITIAATGDQPKRGRASRKMCLTIVDQAEGQSPARLPKTILSLNEKNKQRIRFVQGKFNMGGTGALRFCGSRGLQLVISRRHPSLAKNERVRDDSVDSWSVTVVRREQPSDKSGDPVHSEFTYLAPLGADKRPRGGDVLRFEADALPLMPEENRPYARSVAFGTAIKLYEYETTVGQSNVLMKDGLMFALERLLPEIGLPIRIHECRDYLGKKGSFDTTIAGLVVRLEDGKGDNLEARFPQSGQINVADMQMTTRIYAFKEDRAATYLQDEGVIFAINGQAHGYLPKSIFSRPKAVGLPRLKDSILVLVDCSQLKAIHREDLFMSSRDRLSKKPIRYQLEQEIEELLRNNAELRRLQQERREKDVESKLSEERPLEDVLGRIFTSSPTLKSLFLRGQRLARPFAGGGGGTGHGPGSGPHIGANQFKGRRHPTYFRVPDVSAGAVFRRSCEEGRRIHIKFETDAENGYFDRADDKGSFALDIVDSSREMTPPNRSLILEDGVARLNMALPSEAQAGDFFVLQATVIDTTLVEPLVSMIKLAVTEKQIHPPSPYKSRTKRTATGGGNEPSQEGISLPRVIPVRENDQHWLKYDFTSRTACHVISDPVEVDGKTRLDHTFYINLDNLSLRTEMKYDNKDKRLLEAKFKYANVLLGLAILHEAENGRLMNASTGGADDGEKAETMDPPAIIRGISEAVAPVLIPLIDQLSGLSAEELEELSTVGDDA
jgi:hypothetical protein